MHIPPFLHIRSWGANNMTITEVWWIKGPIHISCFCLFSLAYQRDMRKVHPNIPTFRFYLKTKLWLAMKTSVGTGEQFLQESAVYTKGQRYCHVKCAHCLAGSVICYLITIDHRLLWTALQKQMAGTSNCSLQTNNLLNTPEDWHDNSGSYCPMTWTSEAHLCK